MNFDTDVLGAFQELDVALIAFSTPKLTDPSNDEEKDGSVSICDVIAQNTPIKSNNRTPLMTEFGEQSVDVDRRLMDTMLRFKKLRVARMYTVGLMKLTRFWHCHRL